MVLNLPSLSLHVLLNNYECIVQNSDVRTTKDCHFCALVTMDSIPTHRLPPKDALHFLKIDFFLAGMGFKPCPASLGDPSYSSGSSRPSGIIPSPPSTHGLSSLMRGALSSDSGLCFTRLPSDGVFSGLVVSAAPTSTS